MPLDAASPVLVAGAGYVGQALLRRLASVGCPSYALKRSSHEPPAGARAIALDLTAPETFDQLPRDLRFIVYLLSPDASTDEAYRAAYVTGLEHLLASHAVRSSPLERILFASSTAVYGQTDGSVVDEESATEPGAFSGRRLLEAEAIVRAARVPSVVVRFAGIYGPGRQRLLTSVRDGTATLGTRPHITNRIHRDDCAGFLLHLLQLELPEPLYIGVDDEPSDLSVVLEWLAATLGVPPPRASDTGSGRERGGNKRCSNARLRRSGYRLSYPTFRDGYAELIRADT
jgi:nucleoside-diphosphate-sugar epimerase